MKTRKLAIDAMLAAMCAVLGYLALDTGAVKVTFESLPVILGALLFGPVDGMLVGVIGTFIYQLLRYGLDASTLLWIIPYLACGLLVGLYSKKLNFNPTGKKLTLAIAIGELVIFIINTGSLIIYNKYITMAADPFAYVMGALPIRFGICVVKIIAYALVLPPIIKATRGIARG